MKRRGSHSCVMAVLLISLFPFSGIGSCEGTDTCNRFTQEGCDTGQICERLQGGGSGCFQPVLVRGAVTNLVSNSAIFGARVVALDADGSPISTVATTDGGGNYEMAVELVRTSDGTPADADFTLRADAAGYQTFPSGVRQPIPLSAGSTAGAQVAKSLVIDTALTDIGLIPLEAGAGTASIHGNAEVSAVVPGVLVVAESSATEGFTAIADRTGDYKIFNLPAGNYAVRGYTQGANYTSDEVTLAEEEDASVDLALDEEPTGNVSGTVQIVDAPGGSMTSVILVVESTFDETLARGEAPPGLRAPPPPAAPDVTGAYQIEGVPAGRYVVLAAFENDGLVRDPDLSIGGTSILHIQVPEGQATNVEGFKVTAALEILSPGASGPEAVTAAPTLSWVDDSSEDSYHISVFDTFGNVVWEADEQRHTGDNPAVTYGGPLEKGMYYQFRATSIKAGVPISQTEDLKGVFFVE
jgi:hypothetical protein